MSVDFRDVCWSRLARKWLLSDDIVILVFAIASDCAEIRAESITRDLKRVGRRNDYESRFLWVWKRL